MVQMEKHECPKAISMKCKNSSKGNGANVEGESTSNNQSALRGPLTTQLKSQVFETQKLPILIDPKSYRRSYQTFTSNPTEKF